MRKACTILIAIILAGGLNLFGQGYYNPASVTLSSSGQTNVVYANMPTSINMTVTNPGSAHIPVGDQIAVMVSVNGDPAQTATTYTLTNGLLGMSAPPGGYPNGVRQVQVNNGNYNFATGRFGTGAVGGGGGGGYMHDITIWPTKPAGSGSSVSVLPYDSVTLRVLYVDAAAFSIASSSIAGLPGTVNFNQTYAVALTSTNNGIGVSTRPLEFWAEIGSYGPVLLGAINMPVSAGSSATLPVPAFNLQQLYANNNITLPPNFKFQNHTLRIFAREQGLENNLSSASYTVPASASLPVELASFDGFVSENRIALSWVTAQEINNAGFVVEKLTALGDFQAIGQVDGKGNSDAAQRYFFYDLSPVAGSNRYRLRQVDVDGTETVLSSTLEVTFELKDRQVAVVAYPNVFAESFTLQISAPETSYASLELLDVNGRVVYSQRMAVEAGVQTKEVLPAKLAPGTYWVRFSAGSAQGLTRVVKTH